MSNEQVLCFPADILDKVEPIQGLSTNGKPFFNTILYSNELKFIDRKAAENDPTWKQIIPYQVIHNSRDDTYFNYLRGSNGGEERLKTKRSLGIGGHINRQDEDVTFLQTYYNGMLREWFEEIKYTKIVKSDDLFAVIYDNSNKVGEVHFGFVHLVELPDDELEVVDDAIIKHCWLTIEELRESKGIFESWSQMIIDAI